ncbi:MAG: HslU--HslV peptidase ATPase subunit [Dethiosulfovibrio peptidovorans]|nr:MAG: HslU--HslV peptidase ATPase subunit [Dethiosulfovibrio peptidovorans]
MIGGESTLIPSAIVQYLDRYIVGQDRAKRAVAVALRNRIRRRMLEADLAHEVAPKNILMVGPTGVGKTEIARRLAELVNAPFVKVEATKFTEVGYVGRDVESMVRDLVETAIQMVRKKMLEDVQASAMEKARERVVDFLVPSRKKNASGGIPTFMSVLKSIGSDAPDQSSEETEISEDERMRDSTRVKLLDLVAQGKLDDREVEIEVQESPHMGIPIMGGMGMDEMGISIGEMLGGLMPKKKKHRTVKVKDALRLLQNEEAEKLIDEDAATRMGLEKAQEEGIIFVDEIDKIVARGGAGGTHDVSRDGVQRDLLPVVEGCSVQTKYGQVSTDHILFIAAGAFHQSKPSDLVPELQGRFPIRVELEPLDKTQLARILTEPKHSLLQQYEALLQTEGVTLDFREDGVQEIAALAESMNLEMENIGARRLHTMVEQLLEEISYEAPERSGETVTVGGDFVRERLASLVQDSDVRRYLL